jgi:hypothetical protein
VREYGKVANTPVAVRALAAKLSRGGSQLRFFYEAGPCGYGIQRQSSLAGHDCVVVGRSGSRAYKREARTGAVTYVSRMTCYDSQLLNWMMVRGVLPAFRSAKPTLISCNFSFAVILQMQVAIKIELDKAGHVQPKMI